MTIRGLMDERQRRLERDGYQAWLDDRKGAPSGWWPVIGFLLAALTVGVVLAAAFV